jgi:hypothetical protein
METPNTILAGYQATAVGDVVKRNYGLSCWNGIRNSGARGGLNEKQGRKSPYNAGVAKQNQVQHVKKANNDDPTTRKEAS